MKNKHNIKNITNTIQEYEINFLKPLNCVLEDTLAIFQQLIDSIIATIGKCLASPEKKYARYQFTFLNVINPI